jgi:hypothetical protein
MEEDSGSPGLERVVFAFVDTVNRLEKLTSHKEMGWNLTDLVSKPSLALWKDLRDRKARESATNRGVQKRVELTNEALMKARATFTEAELRALNISLRGKLDVDEEISKERARLDEQRARWEKKAGVSSPGPAEVSG